MSPWPWTLRSMCSPFLISSWNPPISIFMSGSSISTKHGGPSPGTLSNSSTSSGSSSTVILIRLWLALSSLWFWVWCARWVRLLDRHCPAQVGPFAQEVRLRREAKWAFSQNHANRRGFFGSGSMPELKCGEMGCITLTQELKRERRSRSTKGNEQKWEENWTHSSETAGRYQNEKPLRKNRKGAKLNFSYLTLILVLLWRSADDVNLWGA